jgi:hypothetical protein
MSHTPERKRNERPVRPSTLDRRETARKAINEAASRPKPLTNPAERAKLNKLGIKRG